MVIVFFERIALHLSLKYWQLLHNTIALTAQITHLHVFPNCVWKFTYLFIIEKFLDTEVHIQQKTHLKPININ